MLHESEIHRIYMPKGGVRRFCRRTDVPPAFHVILPGPSSYFARCLTRN